MPVCFPLIHAWPRFPGQRERTRAPTDAPASIETGVTPHITTGQNSVPHSALMSRHHHATSSTPITQTNIIANIPFAMPVFIGSWMASECD